MIDFQQLAVFELSKGAHTTASDGVCAMEAVAWLEGLEHTDRPACTCPIIAAYVRALNDSLHNRSLLIPYLPKLVGTVSPQHVQARGEFLAWQAIRVFAPIALDRVGLHIQAEKLREFSGSLIDAANAANDAAYAARTAAAGANAAAGAYDAAAAAHAAAHDAYTAAHAAYTAAAYAAHPTAAMSALDGLLEIGPSGSPDAGEWPHRIDAYESMKGQIA